MAFRVNDGQIAGTYDRRYAQNDYSGVARALTDFAGSISAGRVLEVGCGTGHWLRMLGERGIRAAGLDASSHMLARARTRAAGVGLALGRAESLPWANQAFERVFCINAFHHFEDKIKCLSEARRVLAPGGQVMILGLDPHTDLDRWYIYDYFEPVLSIDRRRYPASSQIRAWMHALRFSDARTSEAQHLPVRMSARAAIEQGRLDRGATSQLAVLSDEDYRRGVERIRKDLESAEAQGEILYLSADLRLYVTIGSVPS